MDPQACLQRIADCARADSRECRDAIEDLRTWIDHGGFAPNWDECPKGARRYFNATGHAIYCTTFCNFGHRVFDGKPVAHECRIIPPEALRAEMDGDYDRAIEILQASPVRTMRGVRS